MRGKTAFSCFPALVVLDISQTALGTILALLALMELSKLVNFEEKAYSLLINPFLSSCSFNKSLMENTEMDWWTSESCKAEVPGAQKDVHKTT